MAAQFTKFSKNEFEQYLGVDSNTGKPLPNGMGFYRIKVDGTWEYVYSKLVDTELNISLRIMSTVSQQTGMARDKGEDAIRVLLFWRPDANSKPIPIGMGKSVKRTQNWRQNLDERLAMWDDMLGPHCKCGAPTVRKLRRSDNQPFFGCVKWPNCPAEKEGFNSNEENEEPLTVSNSSDNLQFREIQRSQLVYLITSALTDSNVQITTIAEAGNILYNEEVFRITDGRIEMNLDAERWLPQSEHK
jgi:hypothetical protein